MSYCTKNKNRGCNVRLESLIHPCEIFFRYPVQSAFVTLLIFRRYNRRNTDMNFSHFKSAKYLCLLWLVALMIMLVVTIFGLEILTQFAFFLPTDLVAFVWIYAGYKSGNYNWTSWASIEYKCSSSIVFVCHWVRTNFPNIKNHKFFLMHLTFWVGAEFF